MELPLPSDDALRSALKMKSCEDCNSLVAADKHINYSHYCYVALLFLILLFRKQIKWPTIYDTDPLHYIKLYLSWEMHILAALACLFTSASILPYSSYFTCLHPGSQTNITLVEFCNFNIHTATIFVFVKGFADNCPM